MVLWPVRQSQDVAVRGSSIIFTSPNHINFRNARITRLYTDPIAERIHSNHPLNNATHLAQRARILIPNPQDHGLPSTLPPSRPLPSTTPLTLLLTEPRRLQIRRRRRSLRISNKRRPTRTPPKARPRNNRPRQRPLHLQKPRGEFRVSLVLDCTPKRWFLSRSHPRTQTSNQSSQESS
jgi:hypothetical protein